MEAEQLGHRLQNSPDFSTPCAQSHGWTHRPGSPTAVLNSHLYAFAQTIPQKCPLLPLLSSQSHCLQEASYSLPLASLSPCAPSVHGKVCPALPQLLILELGHCRFELPEIVYSQSRLYLVFPTFGSRAPRGRGRDGFPNISPQSS